MIDDRPIRFSDVLELAVNMFKVTYNLFVILLKTLESISETIWNIAVAIAAIAAVIWSFQFGLFAGILAVIIIPSVATKFQTWS